jgi:pilus assembly protein Flp/PilA
MQDLLQRFINDQSGTTAIEYALVAALISVAILVALTGVSDTLRGTYYDLIDGAFK